MSPVDMVDFFMLAFLIICVAVGVRGVQKYVYENRFIAFLWAVFTTWSTIYLISISNVVEVDDKIISSIMGMLK
jgi:hypothetical protein